MTTERLYTVYDNKAQMIVAGIIRVNNDEVARRHFRDAINSNDSPLAQHPEDYDLCYIGNIDVTTGIIIEDSTSHSTVVAKGADFIQETKK